MASELHWLAAVMGVAFFIKGISIWHGALVGVTEVYLHMPSKCVLSRVYSGINVYSLFLDSSPYMLVPFPL